MNYKTLITEKLGSALVITINREDKMNALNLELLSELDLVMDEVYNNVEIRGAVITGKGQKAFAAGADIAEFSHYTSDDAKKMSTNGHRIFNKIESCPKPVIACVNGFALGGGCELAMACHIRFANEFAKFGQPEVNLGIIPGYGGTQRLVQLIGKGKALELLMTGDMIKSDEAYRLGLVNKICHAENMLNDALDLIDKIATKSPLVIQNIIHSVNAVHQKNEDGFKLEIALFAESFSTEDFKEGTSAFLSKRKADFKGR